MPSEFVSPEGLCEHPPVPPAPDDVHDAHGLSCRAFRDRIRRCSDAVHLAFRICNRGAVPLEAYTRR